MAENTAEKSFDAVAMMRSTRDRISSEIEGMTLEEELKWLASQQTLAPCLDQDLHPILGAGLLLEHCQEHRRIESELHRSLSSTGPRVSSSHSAEVFRSRPRAQPTTARIASSSKAGTSATRSGIISSPGRAS